MATYNTHTLDNGLRIIHLAEDSEVVYCGYAIKAGTRNETSDNEAGLAHFCEHMTFKGTKRRSSLQVINTLERLGGELNAFTAKEETVYYAAVLRQYYDRATDLLTDIVFHSEYPQAAVEREIEVVCDEIESYNDSPAELIYDEFENHIFKHSSLGHNILGTPGSVRSFTSDDCKRFTKKLYTPDRAVFYIVGNIDFDKLVKRLEKSTPPPQSCRESLSQATTHHQFDTTTDWKELNLNTHQNHVMLGTSITNDMEQWRMPLFLVNNILGGPGMNSRLNVSLREKRGLVYTVESIMTAYTDALVWSVYFGCDKADTNRCCRLTMSEIRRLQNSPLSQSALMAAKRQIKGQLALASQNRESFAIDMAKQYLHYGKLRHNSELFQRIDKVTADDIHRLMNEHLTEDRLKKIIIK